tara:strand:- start:3194 stop:3355 length:162 start_codon:yes stop_codon:yes gene_type:complete
MSSSDSLCRDFAAYLASHKLLWLGPLLIGLIWLAILVRLQAANASSDFSYVLS